ncbi:MAG: TIGR00153 family protein [Simkania negevensis]|nr:TIGR00153 family protein [Simkania negevensis]
MFSAIAGLFGKSPFSSLLAHMKNVSDCYKKLIEIFEKLKKAPPEAIEKLVAELSRLEHEADLTKNDIRNQLTKRTWLPIDRGQFLEILSIQDRLADQSEDIGNLLVLYPMEEFGELCEEMQTLFLKNCEAFWDSYNIMKELPDLIESSFGGIEAEKVKTMIEKTAYKEYEADKMKYHLMKAFFKKGTLIPTPVFYLYIRLIEEINDISHIAEKLANRVGTILELK